MLISLLQWCIRSSVFFGLPSFVFAIHYAENNLLNQFVVLHSAYEVEKVSFFLHRYLHDVDDLLVLVSLDQSAGVGPVVSVVASFPQQTENRTFCPVL